VPENAGAFLRLLNELGPRHLPGLLRNNLPPALHGLDRRDRDNVLGGRHHVVSAVTVDLHDGVVAYRERALHLVPENLGRRGPQDERVPYIRSDLIDEPSPVALGIMLGPCAVRGQVNDGGVERSERFTRTMV
jgi:hypothetical protein